MNQFLEFVIEGPPVSQQARRKPLREQWMQDVRSAAERVWEEGGPVSEPVSVVVTSFFDSSPLDADNVPKPILDALIGLIYFDDSQVIDLLCRKRELSEGLQVRNPSPDLLESIRKFGQCLHISVSSALSQEVSF